MDQDIQKFVRQHYQKSDYAGAIPVSGKVFGEQELANVIEATLEGWWTEGRWTALFEDKLSKFLGVKFVHACNSGSSANLLAFSALCSHTLGDKRIKKGDEVITLAAGFPTTVNPIVQNGCVPVFVDIEPGTYEIDVKEMVKALSSKTKAVMIAHTLGNPFNVKTVLNFCKKNKLWLIEDSCDALGSKYDGQYTGTFGDVATFSFYPAHQVTTAEGGAVVTNNLLLSKIIRSLRDWGRHCWCPTGKDNTCGHRYKWQLGDLPYGYDHKYIYGELGYNLKLSDLHAAIGVAQMDRLIGFTKKRRANYAYLYAKMQQFKDYFVLPEATAKSEPSWFGFVLSIKDKRIDRQELLNYLAEYKIGTRLIFAGNITKQPYFYNNKDIKYRVVGDLKNTNSVMNDAFWIGVFPGIDRAMIDKVVQCFSDFIDCR
jgi:CDP-6-deoxy-D-xylo-4-hexulose-3-dehydrase